MSRNLGILCFYQRLDCLLQSLHLVTSASELTTKKWGCIWDTKVQLLTQAPEAKNEGAIRSSVIVDS